jgi:hypothetical protein
LIVEHEEELLGDLNSNEHHSEDCNEGDTSLQGDDKAAGRTLSERIGAVADAAAGLRVDGSVLRLLEGISLIRRGHKRIRIEGASIELLLFLRFFFFFLVLLLIFVVLFRIVGFSVLDEGGSSFVISWLLVLRLFCFTVL